MNYDTCLKLYSITFNVNNIVNVHMILKTVLILKTSYTNRLNRESIWIDIEIERQMNIDYEYDIQC